MSIAKINWLGSRYEEKIINIPRIPSQSTRGWLALFPSSLANGTIFDYSFQYQSSKIISPILLYYHNLLPNNYPINSRFLSQNETLPDREETIVITHPHNLKRQLHVPYWWLLRAIFMSFGKPSLPAVCWALCPILWGPCLTLKELKIMCWGAEGIRKINTNSCNRKHNVINTTNMTYKERYVKIVYY